MATVAKRTAHARHILVEDEAACQALIDRIQAGEDFAELAKDNSQCPSGRKGGDLGTFSQGMMVPEFDQVIFNEPVGLYPHPVQTQFGYHVIDTISRDEA